MPKRLQDEIKQTRAFHSTRAEAMLSVLRTATVLDHELNEALRPCGITHTQFNVLRILRGAGDAGLCGREVGERLIAKVPDVSRLLDRMEDLGLVSRERDATDRRHVTARITAEGRRVAEEGGVRLAAVEGRRFGPLDDGTVRSLIDALETVRESR